jgi:hypothetical protein
MHNPIIMIAAVVMSPLPQGLKHIVSAYGHCLAHSDGAEIVLHFTASPTVRISGIIARP